MRRNRKERGRKRLPKGQVLNPRQPGKPCDCPCHTGQLMVQVTPCCHCRVKSDKQQYQPSEE